MPTSTLLEACDSNWIFPCYNVSQFCTALCPAKVVTLPLCEVNVPMITTDCPKILTKKKNVSIYYATLKYLHVIDNNVITKKEFRI